MSDTYSRLSDLFLLNPFGGCAFKCFTTVVIASISAAEGRTSANVILGSIFLVK
jgi:hypothetical protein